MVQYYIVFNTDQDFAFPSFERYKDSIGNYDMMITTNDINHFLKDLRADCKFAEWRRDGIDYIFEQLKIERCVYYGSCSAQVIAMGSNCPGHWEPYIYEEE